MESEALVCIFNHDTHVPGADKEIEYNFSCDPDHAAELLGLGSLMSVCLALFGYFLHRQLHQDVPRPERMPSFLRYVALGIGVVILFVWIYGGYYTSDLAVGPGKRWLFFLGLGIILLYRPLYAYRRYEEDRRAIDPREGGKRLVEMAR